MAFWSQRSTPAFWAAIAKVNGSTAGTAYIVSGYYEGAVGGSPPDPNFEVTMNGNVYFEIAAPANNNWDNFSFLYTAGSSDAILSRMPYRNSA